MTLFRPELRRRFFRPFDQSQPFNQQRPASGRDGLRYSQAHLTLRPAPVRVRRRLIPAGEKNNDRVFRRRRRNAAIAGRAAKRVQRRERKHKRKTKRKSTERSTKKQRLHSSRSKKERKASNRKAQSKKRAPCCAQLAARTIARKAQSIDRKGKKQSLRRAGAVTKARWKKGSKRKPGV